MSADGIKNIQRVVQEFHSKFGDLNKVVDRPAEVSREAITYFNSQSPEAQTAILDSLTRLNKPQRNIFDNKVLKEFLGKLQNHSGSLKGPSTQGRTLETLRRILYYCYRKSSNALPPFITIHDKADLPATSKKPDFKFIFMFVNRGGHPLPVIITPEKLASYNHPHIDIDGYIDGMMVVTRNDIRLSIDGKEWRPQPKRGLTGTQLYEKDQITIRVGDGSIDRDSFVERNPDWPKLFSDTYTAGGIKNSQLFISYDFADDLQGYPKYPISFSAKPMIELDVGGYKLELHHFGERRVSNLLMNEPKKGPAFYLQGKSTDLRDIHGIDQKLQAISDGVMKVQKSSGIKNIKEIIIISSQTMNAAAYDNGAIGFTTAELSNRSPLAIKNTTEHEALHIVINASGIASNRSIIDYYATKFNGPRDSSFYHCSTSKNYHPFLMFIAESNFFGHGGGHPHSNIHEFCTSFAHTLLYIEDVRKKLSTLPQAKRLDFLNHYIKLTELFKEATTKAPLKAFFEHKYEQLTKMRSTI